MIARDLMVRVVVAVDPTTPLGQAIRLMGQHRISGLPVVASDGRLVGMVTEGDLLRRAETGTAGEPPGWLASFLRPGHDAGHYVQTHGRLVSEVMTDSVISIAEDTPASDLVGLMLKHHVKRLPVVRDGRLVGIVSRADLVRQVGKALAQAPVSADDRTIERQIHDRMRAESWAPANGVCITVTDGVVQLDGCLGDMRERAAIGVLTENVPGVRRVDNRIICIEPQLGVVTYDPADSTQL